MKALKTNTSEVTYSTPELQQIGIMVEAGFTLSNETMPDGNEQNPW